jgi:hypothetical protein
MPGSDLRCTLKYMHDKTLEEDSSEHSEALQRIFREIEMLFEENAKLKAQRVSLVEQYEKDRLQLVVEIAQLRQALNQLK